MFTSLLPPFFIQFSDWRSHTLVLQIFDFLYEHGNSIPIFQKLREPYSIHFDTFIHCDTTLMETVLPSSMDLVKYTT